MRGGATLLCTLLAAALPGAWAQDTAPQRALQLVDTQEAAALRRLIAAPLPQGASAEALRRHFIEKENAAIRLGDRDARQLIVREAAEKLPQDPRWPNQLAAVLQGDGRLREALPMYEKARQLARSADNRVFYEANAVRILVWLNDPQAEPRLAAARQQAQAALEEAASPSAQRVTVLRALSNLELSHSGLQARLGRLAEALPPAREAQRHSAAALAMARQLSAGVATSDLQFAAGDLATAQQRVAALLRDLERDGEAEAVLQEHLQTIARYPVSEGFAAGAHQALAALRLAQRQWAEAAVQYRLSLSVLDRLGVAPAAETRLERIADLAVALLGQGLPAQAKALFDSLDARLEGDAAARARARLPFQRALVLMAHGEWARAAPLLAEVAAARLQRHGAGHYLTAQAQGLQGVALWRANDAAARERGADLLRQAVLDLRAPRNADQDNDRGLRRALRDQVFATYVEAMAARGGLAALWSLGVADGLRGGVTAQALADAALRASAADPELAALARQEQDARREWQAAEQQLQSGELQGSSAAQGQLRARLSELELQRQQLQQRLRERFPGYEQIQRPQPPDPAAVAERLRPHEQLLMLLPTERALLAWLVSPGELPRFQRIEVAAATLRALVQRVVKGVALEPGARVPAFDEAAAHELHRTVLGPLAPHLKAPELIVAATGVLAPLPWAVLLTEPPAPGQAPAWLVRRIAIVQVPSVAAWLSLRQAPRARPAPEPLLAWGDPQFAPGGKPAARSTRTGATLRYADIPPLPETREELLAIARALKADPQRDLHLGERATRDSVLQASNEGLLAKKRVVLFATHGLVAGELPGLRSPALAMAAPASGGFDGGLLTLDDVLGLKLNADWVVLSACNTAAGDGRAEEMLSGLARGFFYAGTRSVLVTQWAVETESAKRLTTATFEHQARVPTASKAESLRQAMLQVMAIPAYAHPTFWAPYILVGDGAR